MQLLFCKSMEKRRTFFQQRSFKGEVQSRAILRLDSRAQHKRTRRLRRRRWASTRRFRQKSFSVLFSCARNSAKSVALNYLVVRKISTLKMPTKVFFIFCIAFLHCQAKGKQKFVFFTCERDLNLWFIIFWHSAKIQNAIFQLASILKLSNKRKLGLFRNLLWLLLWPNLVATFSRCNYQRSKLTEVASS